MGEGSPKRGFGEVGFWRGGNLSVKTVGASTGGGTFFNARQQQWEHRNALKSHYNKLKSVKSTIPKPRQGAKERNGVKNARRVVLSPIQNRTGTRSGDEEEDGDSGEDNYANNSPEISSPQSNGNQSRKVHTVDIYAERRKKAKPVEDPLEILAREEEEEKQRQIRQLRRDRLAVNARARQDEKAREIAEQQERAQKQVCARQRLQKAQEKRERRLREEHLREQRKREQEELNRTQEEWKRKRQEEELQRIAEEKRNKDKLAKEEQRRAISLLTKPLTVISANLASSKSAPGLGKSPKSIHSGRSPKSIKSIKSPKSTGSSKFRGSPRSPSQQSPQSQLSLTNAKRKKNKGKKSSKSPPASSSMSPCSAPFSHTKLVAVEVGPSALLLSGFTNTSATQLSSRNSSAASSASTHRRRELNPPLQLAFPGEHSDGDDEYDSEWAPSPKSPPSTEDAMTRTGLEKTESKGAQRSPLPADSREREKEAHDTMSEPSTPDETETKSPCSDDEDSLGSICNAKDLIDRSILELEQLNQWSIDGTASSDAASPGYSNKCLD